MKLSDKYLYYPYISIPESTLVHSLLFKDRIKRIAPPYSEMDMERAKDIERTDKICRQYLGYQFIENAEYKEAKINIADSFSTFLDEVSQSKRSKHFESILGKDYKNRFDLFKNQYSSTQYFIYLDKFDPKVFYKLESLGWMKYHPIRNACEMPNELCTIYMALLASSIVYKSGEPISTNESKYEDIFRSPVFSTYFNFAVPPQIQGNNNIQELCINLLLDGSLSDKSSRYTGIPIHDILTFPEAVRIRAGLEDKRKEFCSLIDDLVMRVSAVDVKDPRAFLSLDINNILDAAREYINEIKTEATKQVEQSRKDKISSIQTGLSLTFRYAGTVIDALINKTPPGLWTAAGIILSMGTYFLPRALATNSENEQIEFLSSRQRAYLFMNQLWEIRDRKATT